MTTYVNFVPSTSGPFQFQATLDGALYIVTVTQNIYGQRYYVNVTDLSSNLVVARAANSSTPKFSGTFIWADGTAYVTLATPHWISVGAVANLTASDTDAGFDGQFLMLATGPSTLSYTLADDPGVTSVTGNIAQNISFIAGQLNAAGGYFSSTLIFRDNTQQFEVSP